MNAFTFRLDDTLERRLEEAMEFSGRSRSDIMREALRRQLDRMRFEQLRERITPFAEEQGYLTDEDVFRDVS
jgi:predicted transcriptional regulator